MFIRQTLHDFLANPMGKGSNAIAGRNLITADLNRRLDTMLTRHNNKLECIIYRTKDASRVIFHVKVPSESEHRRNTYDVLIQLDVPEDEPAILADKNLKRYEAKFFSNSPSFTYTYAYAFQLHGMLVDGTEKKFDRAVFQHPPITRNPAEIVGYEKTTYFAAQYVAHHGHWLQKSIVLGDGKLLNIGSLMGTIRTTAVIEVEIKKETHRVKFEAEKEKKALRKSHTSEKPARSSSSKIRTPSRGPINRVNAKKTTSTTENPTSRRISSTRSTRRKK